MDYAMRQQDPISYVPSNLPCVADILRDVECLQRDSLACVRSAQECIRRSDAVLAQLALVWITADGTQLKRP